jgi:hypothetical protein
MTIHVTIRPPVSPRQAKPHLAIRASPPHRARFDMRGFHARTGARLGSPYVALPHVSDMSLQLHGSLDAGAGCTRVAAPPRTRRWPSHVLARSDDFFMGSQRWVRYTATVRLLRSV